MAGTGEGSRGGRVIRHTRGGYAVYASAGAAVAISTDLAQPVINRAIGSLGAGASKTAIQAATHRKQFLGAAHRLAGSPKIEWTVHTVGSFRPRTNTVELATKNSAVLLHELGHAEQFKRSAGWVYPLAISARLPLVGRTAVLGLEADATRRAITNAYKIGGTRYAVPIAKKLAFPLLGYANRALGGLALATVGAAVVASQRHSIKGRKK